MKNIATALLKAQQAMGAATKGANNPYFKSKYADYGAVLEVVKDPLNLNGIVVLQPHIHRDGKNFVQTLLVHAESGEVLSSETEVICAKANDAQALGSAITYARRFGLESFLSLPREDDDGNAASGKTSYQAKSTPPPTTAAPVATAPTSEAPTTAPTNSFKNRKTPAAPSNAGNLF